MDRDAILAQVRMVTLIEDINVSDAEIVALIDSGMAEVGIADFWPFLEANSTVTTVADQQNYALPGDFEYAVSLVDDPNDQRVEYIAPAAFFSRFGNDTGNTSADPQYWTIWENEILISPIPSAAVTDKFTLYYYRAITALASGAAVPEFHAGFHQVLVEYCKWKLWDREEYFDQSERAFIQYARYLSDMRVWYATQVKRYPMIAGDGRLQSLGDPNIPWLRRI